MKQTWTDVFYEGVHFRCAILQDTNKIFAAYCDKEDYFGPIYTRHMTKGQQGFYADNVGFTHGYAHNPGEKGLTMCSPSSRMTQETVNLLFRQTLPILKLAAKKSPVFADWLSKVQ